MKKNTSVYICFFNEINIIFRKLKRHKYLVMFFFSSKGKVNYMEVLKQQINL